jgi:hypothetical protein
VINLKILVFIAVISLFVGCGETDDGIIIGTMVDAQTNLPIPNAKITVGNITDITLQDGTYRLNNVPVGEQTIVTQLAGYKTDSQTIHVPKNSVVTLDIKLEKIGEIQQSGILLREGNQKIDVGIGSNPQISWKDGDIYLLLIYHWDNVRSIWFIIWAIIENDQQNTIQSPVTYGIIPFNASEAKGSISEKAGVPIIYIGNWNFETFKVGEKYKIEIYQSSGVPEGNSALYFIR